MCDTASMIGTGILNSFDRRVEMFLVSPNAYWYCVIQSNIVYSSRQYRWTINGFKMITWEQSGITEKLSGVNSGFSEDTDSLYGSIP